MAKQSKRWGYIRSKPAKASVSEKTKEAIKSKADKLVEFFLKPNYVKPPPSETDWNYIVDIYTKWYRNYFYFCAKYHCSGPNAISPYFETKFARLEYVGDERFNLSYMRHTEQWWEVYQGLSMDEGIATIEKDPLFKP